MRDHSEVDPLGDGKVFPPHSVIYVVHLAAHHLYNSLFPPLLFKDVCTHVPVCGGQMATLGIIYHQKHHLSPLFETGSPISLQLIN